MMANLELCEMMKFAKKLYPLLTDINSFRYFLAEGGRGGGKSQAIARILLYFADIRKCRIVCGRETQNSIVESVYSVFCDLIRLRTLNFTIQASKIISNRTGTVINFRGFREQGRFNVQGMEGIDVLWIDEAQAITKQTLDVLIPTIRKDTAKIFFSMNRHVVGDPVYAHFIGRDDCRHIYINYYDNEYCTQALKKEAEECKKTSETDFNHIWLGHPLEKSEDCVFSLSELLGSKNNEHSLRDGHGLTVGGFDVARYGDDKSACVGLQQTGALHWRQHYADQWGKQDLNFTTGRILMLHNQEGFEKSAIDEDGIGGGPLDTLNKGRGLDAFEGFRNTIINIKEDKFYANKRTKYAFKIKEMVMNGHLQLDDDELIQELATLRYTFDHYQRRILISKDKMKKDGVKSPNLADALIIAVSLIDELQNVQKNQYRPATRQAPEGNLFQIAGVA